MEFLRPIIQAANVKNPNGIRYVGNSLVALFERLSQHDFKAARGFPYLYLKLN